MEKSQIQRIKGLMETKGVNISMLASECGKNHMTIRRVLQDESYNPTIDTIKAIAEALGVDEQYILNGKEFSPKDYQGVKGYIDYNGKITRIDTFKQLQAIYESIKTDLETPNEAKDLIKQDKSNKKTQSQEPLDIKTINLFQSEHYDTSKVATWDFRKSEDEREEMPNNLGNMCKGYEFDISSVHFLNSEAAYICGLFSNNTKEHIDIQKELIAEPNGYSTKKVIRRKYEFLGRKDWETYNVQWMIYVVWQKVRQNKAFSALLKRIPDNCVIVENSTHQKAKKGEKDTSKFWGAKNFVLEQNRDIVEKNEEIKNVGKKKKDISLLKMTARNSILNFGVWEGVNCMGKILTICKHCLENGTEPSIDYELLKSKNIYLLGELLTFDNEATNTQYKTIIFDFDGTLLDTRNLRQYKHLFKDHPKYSEEWKQGRKEYLSHIKDCEKWKGMDDVIEFIRNHKIPTAIVTANTIDRVHEAIKAFGWKDVFDKKRVIGCYSNGKDMTTKDGGNPALFKVAIEKLGIPASDCIALGNEVSDYKAASSIGIEAYNCMWGAKDEDKEIMFKDMRDVTLKRPKEIIEVLKRSIVK